MLKRGAKMEHSGLFLTMNDGAEVYVRLWDDCANPQAIVHVVHGMAEHIGRYHRFAEVCNQRGFIVIGSDLRGHGRTGEKSGLMGYFSPEKGFDRVVEDLFFLNRWAKERFPRLPAFLLGHSLGSFLVRRYLQKYGNTILGAIIMGTGGNQGLPGQCALLIAKIQMKKGPTKPSALLDRLSFRGFNRGLSNIETEFDWLTTDRLEVEKYIQDPFCGFICSAGFFADLFTGLKAIHNDALFESIPKDLPLLVISGAEDPVGDRGRAVKEVVAQYKRHGIRNISTIFFPGARHELLNEINRNAVTDEICSWLQKQLP